LLEGLNVPEGLTTSLDRHSTVWPHLSKPAMCSARLPVERQF